MIEIQAEKFNKYAELTYQILILEDQKKFLAEQLLKEMQENAIDKFSTEKGTFSRMSRASYKYSDEITALANRLKDHKKLEEKVGIAKQTITESIRFQLIK